MKNSDHKLTKRDADLLNGLTLLPRDMRIMGLRRLVLEDRGREGLLLLFADFIGLANQVVESTRTFVEDYLVINCQHYPETAERINLPTVHGALNGIRIAIKPRRGMCHGCAFRQGTPANQSISTTCDAELAARNDDDFMCHEKLDANGEPVKTCAGFAGVRNA